MPGHWDLCWHDPVPSGALQCSLTARRNTRSSSYCDGIADLKVASPRAQRMKAFIRDDLGRRKVWTFERKSN